MKGKKVFTKEEDLRIEFLIEQKIGKSQSEQKRIRDEIRNIGFYFSDFSNKKGYTVEDYRELKRDGRVTIIGSDYPMKGTSPNIVQKVEFNNEMNFKEGLPPLVGDNPRVLVLGSLPGDKSIERQAYYSNPNNCFWKILDALFGRQEGQSNEDFAKEIGVALWDCCQSGIRKGSCDSGFKSDSETPNDLKAFLKKYPSIEVIVLNGKKTKMKYYDKFFYDIKSPQALTLISTSGAAPVKFEEKVKEWSVIKTWLN